LRRYFFIALSGILGAMARYFIKNTNIYGYEGFLPLNTLIINLTGSFLLALLFTSAIELKNFDEDIRIGIGTGFLGAFTTFSSMCKEAVILIKDGHYYSALLYLGFSVVLGLIAAYIGTAAARGFIRIYGKAKEGSV
jgi:fluoride exporter